MGCESYLRLTGGTLSRRSLLRAGAFGGAAWMTGLAEGLARAAESDVRKQPKSLLMIWLQGGPSQLETFDPHPGSLYGGEVKSIATSVSDLQIANTLPATAEQMHLGCLVRSVISKEGDHERATYHVKTGWRPDPTLVHPSIGSILCHQSVDNIEIPRHVSILPSEWPARGGYLGPSFDAFKIDDPAQKLPNLLSRVSEDRMKNRIGPLLNTLEGEFQRGRIADLDRKRTLHQSTTQAAVKMMASEQLAAFDIQAEGKETLDRFGDTAFGRGCLAAIRLLGAGVRCVEVELSGWDTHINNHQLQSNKAEVLDRALAATLQELESRDLLDNTIVFCGGEFGRTPQINPAGGRDHWPHGFSVLLAGGRFRRGHVHGATDPNPDKKLLENADGPFDPTQVTSNVVTVPDLHATLLHALGINHEDEHITPIGRPLRWSDGNVVHSLLES